MERSDNPSTLLVPTLANMASAIDRLDCQSAHAWELMKLGDPPQVKKLSQPTVEPKKYFSEVLYRFS